MNGLDAILESILSEARGKADVLLSEARERAADIRAQGEREAEALLLQMEEAAAGEADAVRARAESSSAMAGRRILLDARRRTVTGLVDRRWRVCPNCPRRKKCGCMPGSSGRRAAERPWCLAPRTSRPVLPPARWPRRNASGRRRGNPRSD
ncbi:MAG: hypothetical protein GX153_08990 [Clostridiaceae bacterium]|nr:hypothetical protein [Clostridiaceae bacterium]